MGWQKVTVCKDCTDRHVGCHVTCEKYKEQKAKWDAELDEINKQKLLRYDAISRSREVQDKIRKRYNKGK